MTAGPPPPADAYAEVSALVETLRATEHRLDELTEGQVDSVTDRDGRMFLLRRAHDQIGISERRRSQVALAQSEAGLRRAQLMARLAHVITGPDGKFEQWSETLPQLIGVEPAELPRTTRAWLDIVHPEDRPLFRGKAIEAGATKLRTELEYRLRRADGEWIHVRQTMEPLEIEGDVSADRRWFNTLQDVTAQKRSEESLRAAELLLHNVVENLPIAVQLKSLQDDFRILMWNKAAEAMFGLPRSDAIGRNVQDLWPDFAARMHAADLDLVAKGIMQDFPDRAAQTMNRGEIRVHMRKSVLFDASGTATHLLVIADDITAQLADEARLRESERRFSDMLANVEMISMMLDREARITYCNQFLLHLTGWRREDVIGRNWFELFTPPEAEGLKDVHAALLADLPEAMHHDNEILTRSGERRLIRWNNTLLRSGAGDVIGTASIGEDITERQKYQETLRQNEARTRLIVETALDAVVVMDAAGCITDWNAQAERTFGWSREQVVGTPLVETIVPTGHREAHKLGLRKFLETGEGRMVNKRIEVSALHRDGHEFPVELTISPLRLGGVWIFSSFIRDLTERKRAEQALVQLRRQSELILESVGEGIHGIDMEGRIIFENPSAARLLGYGIEELAGRPAQAGMRDSRGDGTSYPIADSPIHATMQDGAVRSVEGELFWRKDGSSFPVEYTTAPIRNDQDEVTGAVVAFRDITARKEADGKIKRLNRVYAVLSGINSLIMRVRDRDELFREACRIAVEDGQFQMAWIGVVDRSAMRIVPVASAGVDAGFLEEVRDRLSLLDDSPAGHGPPALAVREKRAFVANDLQTDPRIRHKSTHAKRGIRSLVSLPLMIADVPVATFGLHAAEAGYFDEAEMKLLRDLAGNIAFAIDHIEKQERLDYLAYYDVLTGLANRTLFLERVAQYMRSAASGGHKLALYVIDLERFKNINDTFGEPAGDALLRQVAEWLTFNASDVNLLARVGSDHFAVVLPEVKQDGDVARLLEKSMEAFLDHPFRLAGAVFRIAVKVGVALFPDDGANADTLYQHAEAALKKAKASGDRYLFYTQKMTEAMAGKLTLENQLRQALEQEEFVLHYQPKVNLASGKLTSAEALIRWNDPRMGLVPPGRFIPVLEETGLIHEVGRWALRKAIEDYLRWRTAGLAAVRIAVNVSPLQLRNRGFLAELKRAVGIDAHAAAGLELEITESMIMEDVKHSIASLQAIRAMGISIAIDDFGTGFSSLSYLSKLPVDTLKIDRSFVVDMTATQEGLVLVSTIINLAHSLKLKVVAEGVETEEQSRLLRLLNCDEMQGFLFSRPVPSEIFEAKYLTPLPAE